MAGVGMYIVNTFQSFSLCKCLVVCSSSGKGGGAVAGIGNVKGLETPAMATAGIGLQLWSNSHSRISTM